jgi:outer membrane protein insertion porin family
VDEERKITVQIDEGKKGVIKSINFIGNRYVRGKDLRNVMDTSERGFFSFLTGSGIYREETLTSDLENLRGYYQSRGFPNARFALGEIGSSEGGKLLIKINVDEGVRYRVREIKLRGVAFFATREIWRVLRNIPGVPIDYVSAYADSWKIQKMYFDAGFHDCTVAVSFITDEESSNIDIIYTISEEKQYVLGNVVITGNSKVSSNVILRELPVLWGEVIGDSELIDFQQRLYRTGLFRSVKIRKIKNRENGRINLLMEVEEADALVLEGGAGWGTDSGYRGSMGVTHKNINGLGRKIRGNLIISENDSIFTLDLTEPWFLGLNVEGGINFTYQNTEEESFTLEKISLGGSLTRKFWERSSTSFEITFNRERTKDVSPGAIISPEDVRDDRTIIFRPILVLDQRDNPFNPRRGTFNSLVGELSPGIIGSSTEYFKVTGQSAGYFTLKKRIILALSGRGGYGKSLTGSELPIDKRYFLGGRTTVRGFEEERLGPIGSDGSPIGGDTMINVNAETRYYVTDSVILALFFDAGSVWLRNIDEFDFDLRETAGYSLKYVTPVGPVSFDQGFKLDRKKGESKSEIHFTIGAAF